MKGKKGSKDRQRTLKDEKAKKETKTHSPLIQEE